MILVSFNEEKILYPAKWKNNCSSEQSPKKLTVPFFWGPPTNEKLMANPENDSPYKITHNKKFSTEFDDLGVIIIRKRCSIQQGEKR